MNIFGVLAVVFIVGIAIGFMLVQHEKPITGAAIDCYVENQHCECDSKECLCGNETVPTAYCKN